MNGIPVYKAFFFFQINCPIVSNDYSAEGQGSGETPFVHLQ